MPDVYDNRGTLYPKISVCVTTYRRPHLLSVCLESCLGQSYKNLEIIIGDDSPDDETESLINERYLGAGNLTYVHNTPARGEAGNIDDLFRRATGRYIMLMNDDDLLTPTALEELSAIFRTHPETDIAFGNQYLMDNAGNIDAFGSEQLNARYYRTGRSDGFQVEPGVAGFLQMFPNNGWLARADLVKQIGYKNEYGVGCEFVFGVELCSAASRIYYTNKYVSYYRLTHGSMTESTRHSMQSAPMSVYAYLNDLEVPESFSSAKRTAYKRIVPMVVSTLARSGNPGAALRVMMRHFYSYRLGFDRRFVFHLLLVAKAILAKATFL